MVTCTLQDGWTTKLATCETPPPGAGFTTTTGKLPGTANSAEFTSMLNWVVLMKVVGYGIPLKLTEEEEKKPLPLIVRTSDPDPAGTAVGDKLVIVGCGLTNTSVVVIVAENIIPASPERFTSSKYSQLVPT